MQALGTTVLPAALSAVLQRPIYGVLVRYRQENKSANSAPDRLEKRGAAGVSSPESSIRLCLKHFLLRLLVYDCRDVTVLCWSELLLLLGLVLLGLFLHSLGSHHLFVFCPSSFQLREQIFETTPRRGKVGVWGCIRAGNW